MVYTLITMEDMVCQVHAIGKATRPLFTNPVTHLYASFLASPMGITSMLLPSYVYPQQELNSGSNSVLNVTNSVISW